MRKINLYIAHRWRIPKAMTALFILELPLTIAALVLFGVADPNTYRTKLWQIGSDNGFNSNPNEILYSYANYKPISVPLIWSGFMTQYNVVISVLSMFILLVKSTVFVLGAFLPLLSILVHLIEIALYAVGVRNQATPDLSNTNVPNLSRNLPWYLSKGCSVTTGTNNGYCMMARASFGVTITMLVLFCVYMALAIHSAFMTKEERLERQTEYDDDIELKRYESGFNNDENITKEENWERNRQIFMNLPKTPATPRTGMPAMTPRTTAFTQLSGAPPPQPNLQVPHTSTGGGPSRPLAFREQYGELDGRQVDAR